MICYGRASFLIVGPEVRHRNIKNGNFIKFPFVYVMVTPQGIEPWTH